MNYLELKKTWEYCRDELEKATSKYDGLAQDYSNFRQRTDKQLATLADACNKLEASNKNLKQAVNALGIVISHL